MTFDAVRALTSADLELLIQFYQAVCAQQSGDDNPDWHWGEYPSRNLLREALQTRRVIAGFIDQKIVAAGILSVGDDEDYQGVNWSYVVDRQIAVLHLFAVHPDFRRRGLATALMQTLVQAARDAGQRVIHLDVLTRDTSAEQFYRRYGYRFVEERILNYDDIGETAARMYELMAD